MGFYHLQSCHFSLWFSFNLSHKFLIGLTFQLKWVQATKLNQLTMWVIYNFQWEFKMFNWEERRDILIFTCNKWVFPQVKVVFRQLQIAKFYFNLVLLITGKMLVIIFSNNLMCFKCQKNFVWKVVIQYQWRVIKVLQIMNIWH